MFLIVPGCQEHENGLPTDVASQMTIGGAITLNPPKLVFPRAHQPRRAALGGFLMRQSVGP